MKLFDKTPSSRKLRLQLKDIERTQRQKQRRLQVLVQTKEEWIREAVAAKQAGKQELVLDIFRKLRQLEIDRGYLTADLRRLALARSAAVALRAKLESLERSRDRKGLKDLLRRLKSSALQKAIDTAAVDDDTFGDMLREILAEEEMAAVETKKEDAGFAEFDRAIGEMAEADQYAAGIGREPAQDLRLAGVSGRLRREPVIGAGAAAVSGSVRSLGISGAGIAGLSGGRASQQHREEYGNWAFPESAPQPYPAASAAWVFPERPSPRFPASPGGGHGHRRLRPAALPPKAFQDAYLRQERHMGGEVPAVSA